MSREWLFHPMRFQDFQIGQLTCNLVNPQNIEHISVNIPQPVFDSLQEPCLIGGCARLLSNAGPNARVGIQHSSAGSFVFAHSPAPPQAAAFETKGVEKHRKKPTTFGI